MPDSQNQRPLFFEGQYLGAEDLTAAVAYARTQQARHALGAHTWGIAAGLQLTEKDSPAGGGQVNAYLQPGYAWDGFGRPVVVLAPYQIPAELFKDLVFDSTLDGGTPEGRLVDVWLRYDEADTRPPRPGFADCDTATAFSRVQETFRVEIGPRTSHSQQHDPITVAGYSIDAQDVLQQFDPKSPPVQLFDESVPYQAFPEDDTTAHWLIPLGKVRWKPNPVAGQPGYFVKRNDDDLKASRNQRRYIGVVAGAVQAADGVIRLRDRLKDYSSVTSAELVWVEGDLRVEGDARLFNGRLDFRNNRGLDNGVPLEIRRKDNADGSGSLQVAIGKDNRGANGFSVGPLDAGSPPQVLPKLTVLDDGKVGIGTVTPQVQLDVAGDLTITGTARKAGGGTWTASSDARLKKNIGPLQDALSKLLQLHGVRFEWREPEKMGNLSGPQLGLIAQEVAAVFPEWIGTGPDGYKEMTIRGFEALMVEALRELKTASDALKTRLAHCEEQFKAPQNRKVSRFWRTIESWLGRWCSRLIHEEKQR